MLKGHKNAILELHWSTDGSQIVTASPDETVRVFDVEAGKQVIEENSRGDCWCCLTNFPSLAVKGVGTILVESQGWRQVSWS